MATQEPSVVGGGSALPGLLPPPPGGACAKTSTWLERAEIEALIPHRAPISMLDRVLVRAPGSDGVAEAVFEPGHSAFAGHFPQRPILPGVLIIEACAQLVAVLCRANEERAREGALPALDYLAAVERFKFLSPVVPGERLRLEAQLGRRLTGMLQARVSARAGSRLVAEGVLSVTARGTAGQEPEARRP